MQHERAERAAELEVRDAARLARWRAVCPEDYQDTKPELLSQAKLKEVLAWEYGSKGLLLVGPTGTGKTRSLWLLIKRLMMDGYSVEVFPSMRFSHLCSKYFGGFVGPDWTDRLVHHVDVVCFDDLGKSKMTELVEAEFYGIIEDRASRKRPTILTLNMGGEELEARMSPERGGPIVRRLREYKFFAQVVFKEPLKCE